jgi:hypothetical protein
MSPVGYVMDIAGDPLPVPLGPVVPGVLSGSSRRTHGRRRREPRFDGAIPASRDRGARSRAGTPVP